MLAVLSLAPGLALAQQPSPNDMTDMTLAIAGMIIGIVFVLGVLATVFYFRFKQDRYRLDTVAKFIEKGQPVPRELLSALPPMPTVAEQRRRDLRRGVWMLAWAVGVALAAYFLSDQIRTAAWSLIFLSLSAGSFVNLYLSRRIEGEGKADDLPRKQ